MTSTAPIKPADVPDGSVWDADQQLWVGPPSGFTPTDEDMWKAWVAYRLDYDRFGREFYGQGAVLEAEFERYKAAQR